MKLRYTTTPSTQFVGQQLRYKGICASTNNWAAQCLARERVSEGTVFITDQQYQGRGQRGRVWHSEPHKNLTFSVVLYPTFLEASQGFCLHMVTALALHQALAGYLPNRLATKWPNDLYYQDKKLGGVLIENTVEQQQLVASVIGIGLNVNQTHFDEPRPTSLALARGQSFDLASLLAALLEALEAYYLQLRDQGAAALQGRYAERLYWRNALHTFCDGMHTFQGTIQGVDGVGRLVMGCADGATRRFCAQEISFVA